MTICDQAHSSSSNRNPTLGSSVRAEIAVATVEGRSGGNRLHLYLFLVDFSTGTALLIASGRAVMLIVGEGLPFPRGVNANAWSGRGRPP